MDRTIPLDFTTLCDFVDRLAGLFIMTRRYVTHGSLQNVLLPRTWVVELWPAFSSFQRCNTARTEKLVRVLLKLLSGVYTGKFAP